MDPHNGPYVTHSQLTKGKSQAKSQARRGSMSHREDADTLWETTHSKDNAAAFGDPHLDFQSQARLLWLAVVREVL